MARGRDRNLYRATGVRCAFCGIEAGNSLDIPVYRYRLQRTAYREGIQRSTNVGAVGICDPCIREHAMPPRDYSGRNTVRRHRHISLMEGREEWHTHADYRPSHRHAALGPASAPEPAPARR